MSTATQALSRGVLSQEAESLPPLPEEVVNTALKTHALVRNFPDAAGVILQTGTHKIDLLSRNCEDVSKRIETTHDTLQLLLTLKKLLRNTGDQSLNVTDEMRQVAQKLEERGLRLFDPNAKTISADSVEALRSAEIPSHMKLLETRISQDSNRLQALIQFITSLTETLRGVLRRDEQQKKKTIDGVRA